MSAISSYASSSSYSSYTQSSVRQRPSEEEMAARKKELFNKADIDGSGGLDKTEFGDLLGKAPDGNSSSSNVDDTFSKFDSNGDGSVSQDEMDSGMKNMRSQMESNMSKAKFGGKEHSHEHGIGKPPSMDELFSKADSSGDSSISQSEFADFLSKGPQADSINAQKAFSKYDSNNDGSLSSDEFKTGMKDMMASMPLPPGGLNSDSSSNSPKNIMSSLDANGDGTINEEELTSGLSSSKIQQMISAYTKQMSSSYSTSSDSLLSALTA